MTTKRQTTTADMVELERAAIEEALDAASGGGASDGIIISDAIMNKPKALNIDTAFSREADITRNRDVARSLSSDSTIAPLMRDLLGRVNTALTTVESIVTDPTAVKIGDITATVPAPVRDKPNELYYMTSRTGRHYTRARADALLKAIFGEELTPRVITAASCRGFDQKPLLWVSQNLWEHINLDKSHDYDGMSAKEDTPGFDPRFDDPDSGSIIIKLLSLCFELLTVKNLCRLARYHNMSVLFVIRAIMDDICKEMRI